jgi:hypothetical protein
MNQTAICMQLLADIKFVFRALIDILTLQKIITQNVNKRLIKLSSHSSMVSQDPAFHYEAMMDEELLG